MNSERVVVIGGGWAGVETARALEAQLPPSIEIVVLGSDNHMVFTPLLPEVASRAISPLHVVVSGRETTTRTVWLAARVTQIDQERHAVVYRDGRGNTTSLSYSHLVVACGATVDLNSIPGMAARARPLKSVGDAIVLGNDLLGLCETASLADTTDRQSWLRVVVIGGGFSGVEIAGHIADLFTRVLHLYPRLGGVVPRITLLQKGDRILPELQHPSLSEFAARKLAQRGVEIRLGVSATEITANDVILSSGERMPASLVVCTVGTAPNPLIRASGLPLERNRLVTESDMRVKGAENLWAIGDCGYILNAYDGKPSPPTAQFALRQARQVAKNIRNVFAGKSTAPFRYRPQGILAAIGHRNAVAEIFGLRFWGFPAWFLWRGVYFLKLPTLSRKLQVAVDWAWEMLFPPNVVRIEISPDTRTGTAHYAAGDFVYQKGQPGEYLYLIHTGEAAAYEDERGEPVAVLKAGGHFGEGALLSPHAKGRHERSIRALTPLDLVLLTRRDIQNIATALSSFQQDLDRSLHGRWNAQELVSLKERIPGAKTWRVSDAISPAESIRADTTLHEVLVGLRSGPLGFCIVGSDGTFQGYFGRTELYMAMRKVTPSETPLSQFARVDCPLATPDDLVFHAMGELFKAEMELLPVVQDRERKYLLGVLDPAAVFRETGRRFELSETIPQE